MEDDYNTLTEVARDALIYDDPRLPLKAVAALKPRENEDVRDDAQEEKEREDERDA